MLDLGISRSEGVVAPRCDLYTALIVSRDHVKYNIFSEYLIDTITMAQILSKDQMNQTSRNILNDTNPESDF